MKNLILSLFFVFVAFSLHAEVSDDVWKALINHNVTIQKSDATEVTGWLTSVAEQVVVVIETDGNVVSVDKEDVQSVRVNAGSETSAGETNQAPPKVADVPIRSMYVQFDPLGFLLIGPSIELGFRITPSTLLGLVARFEGLGLLYQDIATQGFQSNASLFSMAIEGMIYQLLPGGGRNRWYFQGMFGYAWGSTSGVNYYNGDYQGTNSHLEIAGGAGYRWRFISGFFLDVGALGGAGVGLTDSYYYTSTPSTIIKNTPKVYFVGALQLHFGWEF